MIDMSNSIRLLKEIEVAAIKAGIIKRHLPAPISITISFGKCRISNATRGCSKRQKRRAELREVGVS